MYKDLRQFLRMAKEEGTDYYVEVKKTLKPKFEVCVVQQKLARAGRFPVIYCPKIEGSELPLVTDVFGSYDLLGLALDLSPRKTESSTRAAGGLVGAFAPTRANQAQVLQEYRRRTSNLKPPQTVPTSKAPVKERVMKGDAVDLSFLPIPHHAEHDSGKYITVGVMICKDPDTGIPNAGIYRHEVKSKNTLGCMLGPTQHASYVARRCAELGKPMEVAIFIGHHPAAVIGSTARGSIDLNELEVMGGLLGEPLAVTSGETVDLPIPADAEIVIEGKIDPRNTVTDGPFAEYTGYYGEGNKPGYLIQVTAITMRQDAIYHDLDPAHREHNLASQLNDESALFDAVKRVVPTVTAVHLPPSGCHLSAYISIKKRVPGEAKAASLAAVRPGGAKIVVVVDDDIDVYNEAEVMWAVATRVEGESDVSLVPWAAGQHLDPTAYDETRLKRGNMTTNILIDATRPINLPFPTRITPPESLWKSMNLGDLL